MESTDLNIRTAVPTDLNRWGQLRNTLWPDELNTHLSDLTAFFAGTSTDIHTAFVAEDENGRLVAFIELNLRNYAEGCEGSPVPYVEGWFVNEDWRGRGVGKLLMQTAERWAKELGYNELASDTELHNHNSIAAHSALGFTEAERVVCFIKKLS